MKSSFLFIFLILFAAINGAAQFARTNNIVEWELSALQKAVEPFYRKPTKKELKTVEPRRELFEKYAAFLRQPDTGLIKLIDDKGCADNTKVVNVSEDCLKYSMPGAGSSFSFRTENYRIARLADLTYTDGSFQAAGVFLHGIFVNLGDIPVGQVTLQTKGMKYLVEFQPESDFEKSRKIDEQLKKGIRDDGFLYRRGLYIVENATFALRSIAYNGKFMRSVRNLTYNEFDFDKRRDVIVIFRIIEKDEAGNVTILWRKIRETDSPVINKENSEKQAKT